MNAAMQPPPARQACPIVAFTDLDDTLFSSLRKQPEDADVLTPVAYLKDGAPISYTDSRQRALLQWLEHCAHVVPVTARSLSAFQRVDVRFHSYAVLSHGATVLQPDGGIDREWATRVAVQLERAHPKLLEALDVIHASPANDGGQLHVQLVEDEGRPMYLMAKHRGRDGTVVERLAQETAMGWVGANPGYRLHTNGNNLAILPPGVGKAQAAAYVNARLRQELGTFMSIGLGDSLTDADFMLACDFALLPSRSQLAGCLQRSDC